jgi:hypothetical protein
LAEANETPFLTWFFTQEASEQRRIRQRLQESLLIGSLYCESEPSSIPSLKHFHRHSLDSLSPLPYLIQVFH